MKYYEILEDKIDGIVCGGGMGESENGKWVKREEAESELAAMRERAEEAEEQLKVKGEYGYSQFVVDGLVKERNELGAELMVERQDCDRARKDLATNAALLAKQHDRNMELETALLIQEKHLRMLTEAVEKAWRKACLWGKGFPCKDCEMFDRECIWVDIKQELGFDKLPTKQASNSKGE